MEAMREAGATTEIIAPAIGGVLADDGSPIAVDRQLAGAPSVLYDAVMLMVADDRADGLAKNPAARDFVADAFAHCKYLGYATGAEAFLRRALGTDERDPGMVEIQNVSDVRGFCEKLKNLRYWQRETPSDTTGATRRPDPK